MIEKRKGFTLVELIVVLVILGILLTLVIPNLTGWIDRAKEKRLAASCRECVVAAQTLAIEAYTKNGTTTPPESDDIIELAGIKGGTASNISLDGATKSVNTLTYSEDAESVTYYRLPSPQYVSGTGIAKEMADAYNWAQANYKLYTKAKAILTNEYGKQDPSPLNDAQKKLIFGDLVPEKETQYIYPMAIYDNNGELLNIQYVTPANPITGSGTGANRYPAAALIIDGKMYISKSRTKPDKKVAATVYGKEHTVFIDLMNKTTFASTREFIDLVTGSDGCFEEAK